MEDSDNDGANECLYLCAEKNEIWFEDRKIRKIYKFLVKSTCKLNELWFLDMIMAINVKYGVISIWIDTISTKDHFYRMHQVIFCVNCCQKSISNKRNWIFHVRTNILHDIGKMFKRENSHVFLLYYRQYLHTVKVKSDKPKAPTRNATDLC